MRYGAVLDIPWLLPGLLVSLVVAFLLGGSVGRRLGARPHLGWALIVGLGIVLSGTLTPSRDAIDFGVTGVRACDLSRVGLASMRDVFGSGDTGLNILMFVPLGVAIGLLPGSRRKLLVLAAAVLLPFAIEATQAYVTRLDRACQSADVIDNLTGLVLGLAAGMVAARIAPRAVGPADTLRPGS